MDLLIICMGWRFKKMATEQELKAEEWKTQQKTKPKYTEIKNAQGKLLSTEEVNEEMDGSVFLINKYYG